jgi:hypothetical protein
LTKYLAVAAGSAHCSIHMPVPREPRQGAQQRGIGDAEALKPPAGV